MKKNFGLYVLLFIFCHSFVNYSQTTIGLKSVIIKADDNDIVRTFILQKPISASFDIRGISYSGWILNDSSIVDQDTALYKLETTLGLGKISPTFYYQYFNFQKYSSYFDDADNYLKYCISSVFIPTYIIEYEETNEQDGFQYGSDKLLGYVNLAQLSYEITQTFIRIDVPFNVLNGGFNIYQYNLTSIGDYKNLFQMVFYITGAPIDLGDGKILSAEQSRFDTFINGYYNSSVNRISSTDCFINGDTIKADCISTGPSGDPKSKLAVTSFFATLEYDISMKKDENNININGFPLKAGFSWLSTAKVNVDDDKVKSATINTNTNNSNNDALTFGSSFIPVAITGNVSSKFLIQSFDVLRPNVVLWTSYIGIPYKNNNANSNKRITFSINFLLLSLLLFIILL
ncbi:hypothetical protein RB653_009252 [Dictyostelium firmibasis]|uniref:Uncharacterized protein n=1 Tax=Dictyostelium firmibasis TaxID=79012 RepID=A0AAN7U2Z6_9MYCE